MSYSSRNKRKFKFIGFAMRISLTQDDVKRLKAEDANGFTLEQFTDDVVSEGYAIKFSERDDEGNISVSLLGMPSTENDGFILTRRHESVRKAALEVYYIHSIMSDGGLWVKDDPVSW